MGQPLISLTKTISETWQQSELAHMLLLVDNQDGLMISDKDTLHNFRFSYESGVYCVDDLSYEEFINAIRSSANTRLTPGWFMPAMTFSRYSYEDQLTSRSTVVPLSWFTGRKYAENAVQPTYASYVVQSGDSLWKIAKNLLGDGTRWTEIAALNKIENTIIRPGDVLKIPQ